jgi:hypothetical protein
MVGKAKLFEASLFRLPDIVSNVAGRVSAAEGVGMVVVHCL